jgi:hypothetical protein
MVTKKGKKKRFPTPQEVTDQQPIAWRSSDDIVEIANDKNGWTYRNLCAAVKEWAIGHAISLGWKSVHFPLAYPSKTLSAGAVFIK